MFLLSSPQQIVENPVLLAVLLRCHAKQTLCLVAIDEVHLYAMHGRSFRVAMCILQRLFFEVVFKSGVWHPLFLGMTATMTDSLLTSFTTLTNVTWNTKNEKDPYNKYPHLLWSDASAFRQRYINMGLRICSNMEKKLLHLLVGILLSSATVCVCVFVNFVSECAKWSKVFEDLLADNHSYTAVLTIHGEMDKNEKFGYVKLYTGHLSMPDYDPRALIGTAAVNTGMDNICLEPVDRFGFPRCPSTLLQERGRNARMAGMLIAFCTRKRRDCL